ncbi:response regulator [Ectothiorhodospiraceae bacterium WFHF3C12]|nr:response regulator [Ectothiorhodospiraceae bacterium WFHF3C12]
MQRTIRKRLIPLTLLPALAVAGAGALVFLHFATQDAARALQQTADLVAARTARKLEHGGGDYQGNRVERTLSEALSTPHVAAIAVTQDDGRVVIARELPGLEDGWTVGANRLLRYIGGGIPARFEAETTLSRITSPFDVPFRAAPQGPPEHRLSVATRLSPGAVLSPRASTAFALVVLGILLLSSLAAGHTARQLRLPLHSLARTIKRLQLGRLDTQIRARSPGEIGELEHAVNAMAASLHRGQQELQRQVEQTTSELRQTLQAVEVQNVELDVARKRALEASKVKSEFLANVSHEIRTPINGILGFADLLIHSPLDAEQRDYVNTIKESCTNLLTIVNDILDFSKIEAGKLVIDNVAFDLRDSVEEVLSLLAPAAYGKSLELVHLIYSDVPLKLYGDPIRIRQVLTNLVHNAIKFTPQGRIVVRVMLEDETDKEAVLRVTVTDTGIGLSPADQSKLFKAFSQADTSLTRRFGGAGLGLIISRKLLEQMGGTIGLESEPEQGSTFWFTLRCLKQPASTASEPAQRQTALLERHILLYDEEPLSRLATKHVLESWGVRVSEVDDRQSFQSMISAGKRWDAAVVGLTRGELNDRSYQSVLPKAEQLGVPLLVMASTVDRNELRSLYQQGARVCLPKAVRRQTLYRELCRLLSGGRNEPAPLPGSELPEFSLPRPATQQPAASGLRVLVVDDNDINRKLVCTILRRHQVDVREAEDGRRAVDIATAEHFHLIFMDIQMPTMSGEEAARLIREHYAEARAPRIVALTANAMHGERERLLTAGMDDCLIKPITEDQVTAILGEIAGSEAVRGETPASGDEAITVGSEEKGDDELPSRDGLRAEMREMLVAELPQHKRAIQRAYRRNDVAELKEKVHKLHGAVSVCHMPDLKAACADLENSVISEDRVSIPSGVQRLMAAINETVRAEDRQRAASQGG